MFVTEWLDTDQIIQIRDRALENAILRVKAVFERQGEDFARALFFTHLKIWGVGPYATSDLLIRKAHEHIDATWQWSDHLCGILLKRHGDQSVPLLLQTPALAKKLTQPNDLWIDFTEVRKALNDA